MKIVSYLTLIIVAMLMGCKKDTTHISLEHITINSQLDSDIATRSETINAPTRYILEVYSSADYSTMVGEQLTNSSGQFTIVLDTDKSYYILMWADVNGDANYSTTSLKAVEIVSSNQNGEAWAGKIEILAGRESKSHTITLKRAVAKVKLVETGEINKSSSLVATFTTAKIYNVSSGSTSKNITEIQTININEAVDASGGNVTLGEFHLFAPQSQQMLVDFSFKMNDSKSFVVSNIPLQANYITDIIGTYNRTSMDSFSVLVDHQWQQQADEEPETPGDNTTLYRVGDLYPNASLPIGVVVSIYNSGKNGKIASLGEIGVKWSTNSSSLAASQATSSSNGMANMAVISSIDNWRTLYPAAAWVDDMNDSGTTYISGAKGIWYLPAIDELAAIANVMATINETLDESAYAIPFYLEYAYWSSSTSSTGTPIAYSCKYNTPNPHVVNQEPLDAIMSVRAVRSF